MNLYTAVALPLFLLTLQPSDLHSEDKGVIEVLAPKPQSRISFGNGIDLIVKGLSLNIDNIRFIKAPKASDYFKKANDKAAYAPSLIIGALNGIESLHDLNPESPATREQFAIALYEAISHTGQYPVNMMFINIKDEKAFANNGMNAVQTLIKFKVVALENGNYRPKAYITKAEAEKMVKNAAEFVQAHKNANAEQGGQEAATFKITPVNDKVSSVLITVGNQPTSGYSLSVTSIVFPGDNEAVIHYKITPPASGGMNLQVISEVKAEAFIPAGYKVTLTAE
ncbi:protease complex subunit PrcB family protein [Chitinophaga arvensicola]|uniref:S-layer homology domain-containing protein n=1 Tax=Chitinophaga arvensicola TaxID=29529 RepID=A0A1I0REQ6_9BACT|nr:protease complex subunit PrcB family protein [Chitinophaga arvensicola]SEW39371.1 S-layer homology domain-containing protein [Chitinophaga arvensicola]